MTPQQRFWAKVAKGDECWLWTAATNDNGYGVFGIRHDRLVYAHRYSYGLHNIPAGHEIDHLCRVRACVKPDHLEAVTREEHIRRQHVRAKSGVRGVFWDAAANRWMFVVQRDGVRMVKRFKNRTDAEVFSRSFHGRVAA